MRIERCIGFKRIKWAEKFEKLSAMCGHVASIPGDRGRTERNGVYPSKSHSDLLKKFLAGLRDREKAPSMAEVQAEIFDAEDVKTTEKAGESSKRRARWNEVFVEPECVDVSNCRACNPAVRKGPREENRGHIPAKTGFLVTDFDCGKGAC